MDLDEEHLRILDQNGNYITESLNLFPFSIPSPSRQQKSRWKEVPFPDSRFESCNLFPFPIPSWQMGKTAIFTPNSLQNEPFIYLVTLTKVGKATPMEISTAVPMEIRTTPMEITTAIPNGESDFDSDNDSQSDGESDNSNSTESSNDED